MRTIVKIRIEDNPKLRAQLDTISEQKSQTQMAQWSIGLARHILILVSFDSKINEVIQEGFLINEKWQKGKARMHDVRQLGFKIHNIAKKCPDPVIRSALRVIGHAVSSGHMKEHAMVASDYAIQVINRMFPNDMEAITKERNWQLDQLK